MGQSEKEIKVLCLCEKFTDLSRVVGSLDYLGLAVQTEYVSTISELIRYLESGTWTLILAMSNLDSCSPREALQMVKKISPEMPFILVTIGMGEEEVVDLMKAGAEDVVLLSRSQRLLQAVRRILKDSEVKEKEEKASRIAHEAYAAREQMLAVVSHDIKNPLSAIQLEAQMLLRMADRQGHSLLPEEIMLQGKRILKITDRLKLLITDLLDKNKLGEGLTHLTKEMTDILKIIQEVIDSNRSLLRQKEIQIKTCLGPCSELLIDKNKIIQVLNNLLCNAIKFTPQHGVITVTLDERDQEVLLSVQDNGIGLESTYLNKVFEKYWTAEVKGRSGTGLGLFICKTIVEAHGGIIRAENLPCGGARFSFNIPRTHAQQSSLNWSRDFEKKILVIDDDDDLREVICWALNKEGFAVHSYGDPRVALDNLGKGRHRPELMVVDFHMDGMKGSEFLRQKSKSEMPEVRDCPVLMISAAPREVEGEVEPGLCLQVIPKPLDLGGLMEKIRAIIK